MHFIQLYLLLRTETNKSNIGCCVSQCSIEKLSVQSSFLDRRDAGNSCMDGSTGGRLIDLIKLTNVSLSRF